MTYRREHDIMDALNFALVLLVFMLLGFITNQFKLVHSSFLESLTNFVFKIIFPALIINSMQMKDSAGDIKNAVIMIIISTAVLIGTFILGSIMNTLTRCKGDKGRVLRHGLIFPNFTFLAFPVMEALYGQIGLFYISFFVIPVRISYYMFSGFLVKGFDALEDKEERRKYIAENVKKAFLTPAVLAVPVGLLIYFFSIPLPFFISKSISMLAGAAAPLGMLISGLALNLEGFKEAFKDKKILMASVFKLIIVPLSAFLILSMMDLDPMVKKISILYCALPTASSAVVFAIQYKSDLNTCVRSILASNVYSVLTLPFWSWVVESFI
jgi:predicted permease